MKNHPIVYYGTISTKIKMLSSTAFHQIAETLGERFLENPGNFVTESDLQVQLVSELEEAIGTGHSKVLPQFAVNGGSSYKGAYEEAVYEGYQRNGISPIHTEISVRKGERIDVGVLGTQNPTVRWENGSKKFDDNDVAALFELKFVKNRKKPPTTTGFRPYKERNNHYPKGTLQSSIDWDAVGVKSDIEALGQSSQIYSAVLIFSSFNYFYHFPTKEEIDHAPLYQDLGAAAWDMLQRVGNDMGVNVLYVAPELPRASRSGGRCGGMAWIHEEI